MNSCKRNNKGFLRFLGILLPVILLFGSVTAFGAAKATLQGGTLFFEKLIETKEESIVRTKVTGNRAEDITQKINVEYIEAGSEIVLEAAKDLDGTIVGVLSRSELNEQGTRITKTNVEVTIAGDRVHLGTMELDKINGISAEQSIGVSFDNKNLPGAVLGDQKALYELQLLFTPKKQKPFFYTYYLRLVDADEGKIVAAPPVSKTAPETVPPVNNTAPETVPPANNTAPETVPPANNTAPETVPPANNKAPETVPPANNTAPETVPPANNTVSNANIALPSSTKINVNGTEIACEVYSIDNLNYFKLRDLAMVLNNTAKSFSVNWLEAQKTIGINTRSIYKPIGGELAQSDRYIAGGKTPIVPLKSTLLFDNVTINLDGYIIKGNAYFKVRDLAQLIDVSVSYDQANDTMVFNTSRMYE